MPKNLQKSLQDYISMLKKPNPRLRISPNLSSTNWILSGCKHPKTLSFAVDPKPTSKSNGDDAATLADIDRFLFENFKSLYQKDEAKNEENPNAFLFESPRLIDVPSDLCGSHRFFVTPGLSSSLIEEARLSATTSEDMASSSTATTNTTEGSIRSVTEEKEVKLPEDSIAVLTYSPSPHKDFSRSMREMIEARLQQNRKVDWDFMEELLFCYLNLNEKKSYKYILSAFVDVIVVLRQSSGGIPAKARRRVRVEGLRRKKRGEVT